MIIVGVTGKSGSGKSTVSTIIKNNTGAVVIDADRVAKEMMTKGKPYYNDIVKLFGEEIVVNKPGKNNGKIDKAKLARKLFKEETENREKMNKLTFKHVGERTKEIILENKDKEFIVLDFPLLYEGGFNKICNYVIGVIADEETTLSRLKERDGITKNQAIIRLNTQIKEEDLKEKADFIIDNSNKNRYINLVKDVIKVVHKMKNDEGEKNKK